jgi:hypothetical protein
MPLSRADKFARRGVVWFETDDVLARTTDTRKMSPQQIVRSLEIAGMGGIVAAYIRQRFTERRQTAQGAFGGYRSGYTVWINKDYADAIGATRRLWPSRREFVARYRVGMLNAQGGMWRGLQARSSQRGRAVVIDFRETSIGQHGRKARRALIKRGARAGLYRNQRASSRASNKLKAATVFNSLQINPVQPAMAENMAMADAVSNKIGIPLAAAMGAESVRVRAVGAGDGLLYTRLARYWRK